MVYAILHTRKNAPQCKGGLLSLLSPRSGGQQKVCVACRSGVQTGFPCWRVILTYQDYSRKRIRQNMGASLLKSYEYVAIRKINLQLHAVNKVVWSKSGRG